MFSGGNRQLAGRCCPVAGLTRSWRWLAAALFFAGVWPAAGQGDASLEVGTAGHGEPQLVFLSEPAAPRDAWDHVVARFEVAYRCHVFAPLMDGDFQRQAGTVIDYVREQGLVRPVLVGHGPGGAVAIEVALQAPELPGRLVLVDCLPDPADDLGKIRCPTLVLGALAGPYAVTRRVFRRQYRGLPGVRFRFFARVGHFLMVDDLDGFTDALRRELIGR